MTDQTEQPTTSIEDMDRATAKRFAWTLFWLGPISFVTALMVSGFASSQYDGAGLAAFAIALAIFGALSMLLWLTVGALGATRDK
jgi:FtsH-binding integral membrane protein